MKELFMIGVGAAFINNVVLSQFLGICAFLGVSKKTGTAAGMGAAVVFVITLSSLITGVLYRFILVPLNVEYLQTIVFILIIAALVQFVEMALKKYSHALYEALGVYLPLITTNCAVLGVALINVQRNYSILEGVVTALPRRPVSSLPSCSWLVSGKKSRTTIFRSPSRVRPSCF